LDRQLAGMDLVSREEFETVREMAEKARNENDDLRAELELIKKKISK
ncbi:MAG: accessory factor UbiK family protein, partial [Kordiimonadaceae bacterium]|nr:accessory factor UbiK family protein [Kordiimonadaceae bacterium]